MDRTNISKSVLSISSPSTHLNAKDDLLARKITRETNTELAQISASHPDRFAFFASLPLPDVEGSLEEIDFSLDKLNAKGFAILTNANGTYLGDGRLEKVFAKLNERRATVFIHPTTCRMHFDCASSGTTEMREAVPLLQYPTPMMEFFFDTARAVINLLLSGTVMNHPNITFIIPHCGSVLPSIVERFTSYVPHILGTDIAITSDDVKALFKTRFFFDLAGYPFPDQIHGLLRFTDPSRLLYGTDFPFFNAEKLGKLAEKNDREIEKMFDSEIQKQIYSGNALKLLF
jgi:predicted TIM-barrel fold metal-dependent hydrolase